MRWILPRFRIDCQQEVLNYFSICKMADRPVLYALMKELLFRQAAIFYSLSNYWPLLHFPAHFNKKLSPFKRKLFAARKTSRVWKEPSLAAKAFPFLIFCFLVGFVVTSSNARRFRSWFRLFFGENGRRLRESAFLGDGFKANQLFLMKFTSLDCWFFISKQVEFPN